MSARPTNHPADHQTTRPSNQQVGSPARLPAIIRGRTRIKRSAHQPNPSRGERLLCWGSFRPRARGRQRAKPTSDTANFAIWRAPIRLAAGICKDHCRKSRVSEPLRPDGVVIICHRLSSYLSPMFSDTNDADFAFFRAGGMENCVFRSHRARICHHLSSFVIVCHPICRDFSPGQTSGSAWRSNHQFKLRSHPCELYGGDSQRRCCARMKESKVFVPGSLSSAVLDYFPPRAIPVRFLGDGGISFRGLVGFMALEFPSVAGCPDAASTWRLSALMCETGDSDSMLERGMRLPARATRSTRQRAVSTSFSLPPRLRSHAKSLRRVEL